MALDRRQHAFRPDLADARLRDAVQAAEYVTGSPARIKVGRSPALRAPEASAPVETCYHYGERVLVFEVEDSFCWCQSLRDGYVAYVPSPDVDLTPSSGAGGASPYVTNMGCFAYAEPDLRSRVVDFLPRRSTVALKEARTQTRGTTYVESIDGLHVPERCLASGDSYVRDLVENAARYLGAPYLWGGRSFLGLDCSALVQNAFEDANVVVPRDSDLQASSIGAEISPADASGLERNDLLFLPGHVVIYDGAGSVIHADGSSMMVVKEPLAKLAERRSLAMSDFRIRRPRL